MSSGSCPVDGPRPRLNHSGEATAFSRADPITSIPGISPGITVHGHCLKQGLPEPASETEIGPCNYHREGTTFVDSIEHYLSRGTHLSPAEPETFHGDASGFQACTDTLLAHTVEGAAIPLKRGEHSSILTTNHAGAATNAGHCPHEYATPHSTAPDYRQTLQQSYLVGLNMYFV